ncbi:MAG: Flp pilus assembly complex ATPase component TadA [Legionellales bacterium]|nr:Flp pilus assembly complex ATPase component TadA [Legionellales bacterium]
MRKKIGELLLEDELITQEQLSQALEVQKQQGSKIGEILLSQGDIDKYQLARTLSKQLNIDFVDVRSFEFNEEDTLKLPENFARKYQAMVLKEEPNYYLVAMSDPTDIFSYDEITTKLDKPIKLVLAVADDLSDSIDLVYRHREEITGFAEELSDEIKSRGVEIDDYSVDVGAEDAPVVKLLKSLFSDAVHMNASDIHIEPDESILRIRLRIDGDLQETLMNEKKIANSLTLRLKLMAGLNIAEKRVPQDGRFNIKVKDQSIDVRLSTLPTHYGETVVMRILNQSKGILSYEELGIVGGIQENLEKIVQQPYGMVLVTGPTGSGKTTTLYSVLKNINVKEKKIITVEDPIEYHLPRINQVQIHEKVGLTFTRVLHSALRHDPDIIMVGEIRDEESTNIALRASMTGHLVLATLHTNDAASSPLRLVSMGVDSFLVATSLTAVLAQRLVKKVCNKCTAEYNISDREKVWLDKIFADKGYTNNFKKGNGCSHCNGTGYLGRIGVFELLILDENMNKALNSNNSNEYYEAVKNKKDYISLGSAALNLALQGITTIEEAKRVLGQLTDQVK